MSNYKFNINPKEPSPEMLAKHKDFGKVLANYQKMTHPLYRTPLYRFRRIGIAVILVLTLTWMVVEFGGHREDRAKQIEDSLKKVKADSLRPNAND
jgi:hypothetical protein